MVKPYLNQVGGNVNDDVSMFTGGLNSYQDKAFLESDQMPYCMNMCMVNPPKLETRPNRVTLGHYMEGGKWALSIGKIIDLWAYNEYQIFAIVDQGGTRRVEIIYNPVDGLGHHYGYYTRRTLPDITIPEEENYYFTLAKKTNENYLYITGLTFKVKIRIYDDPSYTDGAPVTDGHYGICCWHKGRLFLGQPDKNIIEFSALRDYDNFDEEPVFQLIDQVPNTSMPNLHEDYIYLVENTTTTPYTYDEYKYDATQNAWVSWGNISQTDILLDTNGMSLPDYSIIAGYFALTNNIGKLISLKSFDDKLMIFCEHSIHCVYGDTPDIEMSNRFQLVDINNNLGAVSDRCIAIGGGRLFWLGDNKEVYEYTGSSLRMVSRPGKSRNETISAGAVSGLIDARDIDKGINVDFGVSHSKFTATSEKLYINIWNAKNTDNEKLLFVFDIYNRTWWCEDGEFNTIGNYSEYNNRILLGKDNGDILISNEYLLAGGSSDLIYDFVEDKEVETPISYEFHTRVYGADGTDLRESIDKIWFQARAEADVYFNDMWTDYNEWAYPIGLTRNEIKIGELKDEYMMPIQKTSYRPAKYEQQVCYLPKMYGERLNTFQIIIRGEGASQFFLMKRMWRAR